MRFAAFNTGPDYHLLDHIGPIAASLGCPLFTTEELNFELAKRYYPQVDVHFLPDMEFRLGEIAQNFDVLFECKYWLPHLKKLFQTLYMKEILLVFCQHGQSDKGYLAPVLSPYSFQDGVFIHGELMLKMLNDLDITPQNYAFTGNHRLEFYQKYRTFYDALLPPIDRKKPTLLYAPTWVDLDQSSSFYTHGERVLKDLPDDWNLIIKLHPLLKQRNPAEYAKFQIDRSNVFLFDEFPPVYPILFLCDFYLGDASSVGYDFLFFEKPLYFFPTTRKGRLHKCGKTLDLSKNIFSQIKQNNDYLLEQKMLYNSTYSSVGGITNNPGKLFKWVTAGRTSMS